MNRVCAADAAVEGLPIGPPVLGLRDRRPRPGVRWTGTARSRRPPGRGAAGSCPTRTSWSRSPGDGSPAPGPARSWSPTGPGPIGGGPATGPLPGSAASARSAPSPTLWGHRDALRRWSSGDVWLATSVGERGL